jgi:hypothetical protein
LKIAERVAAMLGTDAPVRVDAVQLTEVTGPQPTSTEKIRACFDRIRGRSLPAPGGNGADEPEPSVPR